MDTDIAEAGQAVSTAETPSHVLADVLAGLDDLKHSRGVDGAQVLADIDRRVAAAVILPFSH